MRRITAVFLIVALCAFPLSNAEAKTPTYQRFYKMMNELWRSSSAPFSVQNIQAHGGRILYCSDLRIATEQDTGITLTYSQKGDFVQACSDFLKSKGR